MVYLSPMARPVKTQWDFQDLFANVPVAKAEPEPKTGEAAKTEAASVTADVEPVVSDVPEPIRPAPARRVLSVAELTARIRKLLESQVGFVWVSGEITNLRIQS